MCWFIKQIRDLCLAKTNIVLQQWYTRFLFYSNYFQCMNNANDLFWRDVHLTFCISSESGSQFLLYRQDHLRPISYSQTDNNCWKHQCMEWQRYIYVTCKRLIVLFWNYRKFDRYRSWNSRIISLHSWSTRHTISQKQSYMVSVIPVITYAISTFWHKRSNS